MSLQAFPEKYRNISYILPFTLYVGGKIPYVQGYDQEYALEIIIRKYKKHYIFFNISLEENSVNLF